jgi:SSS family transporter
MLLLFIIIYLAATLFIGIFSARYVKNSGDFILAGRQLSLLMATATEFATWFGSETVMGASSKMADGGLLAVIEDPFGASLCLILVGVFFARPLYRMRLLTFGDYYRNVFGRRAEFIAAVSLIISYFGWVAAQMSAIGIVLHIVAGIDTNLAIAISSVVVVGYTFLGGMWSVAITDLLQMIIIIIGLIIVTFVIVDKAGGMHEIIARTPPEYFRFFPESGAHNWILYMAAWATVGLGSIPQQDVYQRVMSSRTEKIAVNSSYISALLYMTIALLPLLLGLAARVMDPGQPNSDYLVPNLIMAHTNTWMKIFFFGALLSAIMSTASGALLAPAVILSENILKPRMKHVPDKKFLLITRLSILGVAIVSLVFAFSGEGIYELVSEASQISLVTLFIPLCAGLFFRSKNEMAAVVSMIAGMVIWFICARMAAEEPYPVFERMKEALPAVAEFPSIFSGLLASLAGYLVTGAIFPRREKPAVPN